MVRKIVVVGIRHYEDPFDIHVTGTNGPPAGCGHQRNRSLDSVLQRIPEDMTPTSPDGAPLRISCEAPGPRLALPPEVPTGSDDSGIHTPPDGNDEERPQPPAAARSRESLDSGNPEETEKPPDPPDAVAEPPATSSSATETSKNKDFLLRLFESKLFDMSMAISYLFNSKEPGVQTYLANKLFSFPHEDVDFYLPQLATMYIEMGDVADVLRPYLVYRCKQSAQFSLRLAWLLTAFSGEAKRSRATKLRDSILAEEIRPAARRGHHRSQSDASALRLATPSGRHLGDLASGRAFDSGCLCGEQCSCGAPRLAPQTQFLTALTNIGRRLATVADKERRNGRLRAELATLDLNLPARVWLPLHQKSHYVLRIPPHAAAVLNSKDKAPYIMYVEVLETEGHEPLPLRLLPPAPPAPHSPPIRHTKSEENLVPEWPALSLYSALDDVDAGDCWSHDDEELSTQYAAKPPALDSLSQVSALSAVSVTSAQSTSSCGSRESLAVGAGEVRRRLADATAAPPPNAFRHDPADPSALALKESWESKLARMRTMSPYGSLGGWRLLGCIVKVGDDLRQEMLAAQLLRRLQAVWELERVPLRLRPYEILCLDRESGLIQPVLNSVSLHQIKKQSGRSLRAWLELEHGPPTSEGFLRAQRNFVQSAAAYALTSYLLQLKDRTLSTYERLIELTEALKNIKFDILGLSEVRRFGNKIDDYGELILCYTGETAGKHGVGFIVKQHWKKHIESYIGISERVAILNLNINNRKISLIQVYAPTESASKDDIDKFYETLNEAMKIAHKEVHVMGDFNAKIGQPRADEYLIMKLN
ncbi:unnamed protein product [Euphydryas editha]|uniref:Phosphatidylinositol 4-kinase beta n=1 Tax=Euphydryas editha TaxID=104508 RepID=A0AAU9V8J5_EUPED|nr:unnamed protein product [Euphydryas editha]